MMSRRAKSFARHTENRNTIASYEARARQISAWIYDIEHPYEPSCGRYMVLPDRDRMIKILKNKLKETRRLRDTVLAWRPLSTDEWDHSIEYQRRRHNVIELLKGCEKKLEMMIDEQTRLEYTTNDN